MEQKIKHQENTPKKTLEEEIKNLEEKDPSLKRLNLTRLFETVLLVCRGLDGRTTGAEEVNGLKRITEEFFSLIAERAQNIQAEKEKNLQ